MATLEAVRLLMTNGDSVDALAELHKALALAERFKPPATSAGAAPSHPAEAVIQRVFTGDGAQLENLDLTDEEWRAVACDTFGPDYAEHFEVTVRFDDWLEMGRIARAAHVAGRPQDDQETGR